MAYWQRKRVGSWEYVAVYVRIAGKPKALPRDLVRHLDKLPDAEIHRWVKEHAQHEGKARPDRPSECMTSEIEGWIDSFLLHLKQLNRCDGTLRQHEQMLKDHAIPYFLSQNPPLGHPEDWSGVSIRLQPWLESRGATASIRRRVNVSLRLFYRWLVDEGIVRYHPQLRLRNPPSPNAPTPLKAALAPQDIVGFVSSITHRDIRLLALIGYGMSLRPQEVVALRPIDFVAGDRAARLECCRAMHGANLFERLAVRIHRQRRGNEFVSPKASSRGMVACADGSIATLLVWELSRLPPGELVFRHRIDWYYSLWRRLGMPGITLKDLRRASILHLGNHTELPFAALKSHARHSDPATTSLYVRRPEDEVAPEADFCLSL